MSEKNTVADRPEGGEPVSLRRRGLLRAAAAAPMIATLSSGSAWAMASASQCVIRDQGTSQGKAQDYKAGFLLVRPTSDEYVRRKVTIYAFKKDGVSRFELFELDGIWYNQTGVPHTVTGPGGGGKYTVKRGTVTVRGLDRDGGTPGYVLAIWRPDALMTGVDPVGVYPIANFDSGQGDMGITGSCLTSVDPNFKTLMTG